MNIDLIKLKNEELWKDIPSENEIMSSWNGNPNHPVVSICCATFNHSLWITDALNSFLNQQTNFPFEIIVRDDASTDGTSEIIQHYAYLFPNIIKYHREPENLYSKGIRPRHAWLNLVAGKYIALCEGDDFWLTNDKLQKQVDLLEINEKAVMSVALTKFCHQIEKNLIEKKVTLCPPDTLLNFKKINGYYFHTSTYVIRSNIYFDVARDYLLEQPIYGDTALRAILLSKGNFILLPEVVSVYRMTGSGIWTSLDEHQRLDWEFRVAKELAKDLHGIHSQMQKLKASKLKRKISNLTKTQQQF